MDDITAKTKLRSAEEEILALAREHGVTYQPTELDELADTFARLSGDDVQLDDTELLLLALEKAGHLSTRDANRLHIAYMRQHRPWALMYLVTSKHGAISEIQKGLKTPPRLKGLSTAFIARTSAQPSSI